MVRKAFMLVELIIAVVLIAFLMLLTTGVFIVLLKKINSNIQRSNIYVQIAYALGDIKIRCVSASDCFSYFSSGGETRDRFEFQGESDIYHITPDDTSDNIRYGYFVDSETGNLILQKEDNSREVLVEAKYNPQIEFKYRDRSPPNFLTVTIAGSWEDVRKDVTVSETEGISFWFVDVVR